MAFSPTVDASARSAAQANLLNAIDSRRGFSFDKEITELIPNETPFISTLMAFKRMPVTDPDHKYQEHRPAWLDGRTFFSNTNPPACSATYAGETFATWLIQKTADGSDAVDFFTASANEKYVLQVVDADDSSKFCNFLVTTVNSSVSLDVIQLTDTPGFDVADNDKVTIIGTAFAEGSNKTTPYSDRVSIKWASCQIFKTSVKATRTTMKLWVAGGNEWERIQGEQMITHKVDIERQCLLGSRTVNVSGAGSASNPFGSPVATALGGDADNPIRTSISIQQAARWADSVGIGGSRLFNNTKATYTYSDFVDDMAVLFEFGNDSRYFFGGRGVLSFLTKMALDVNNGLTYQSNQINDAGVKYTNFRTPHGDLKFVVHPLFRGDYANKGFAVDMNLMDLMVFDGTFVREDVQTPGYDGKENEIISDVGLIINLPESSVAEFNFL